MRHTEVKLILSTSHSNGARTETKMHYSKVHPFNCYTYCLLFFFLSFFFCFLFIFLQDLMQKRNTNLMRFRKIFSNKVNQPIKVESKRKFWLMNLMTIQIISRSNSWAFWLIEFSLASGHSLQTEFQPVECFYFIFTCKKDSKIFKDASRKLALWSTMLLSRICDTTLKIFLLYDIRNQNWA